MRMSDSCKLMALCGKDQLQETSWHISVDLLIKLSVEHVTL